MMKGLHPRDGIDRLSLSRKGRGVLNNIENSMDASIQGNEDYIEKNKEGLASAEASSNTNT